MIYGITREHPLAGNTRVSGGARPQNWGGGAFEGQTHILGGKDRIFKKVLLFAHAVVTGLSPPPPPPGVSPPSQKGGDIPRNIAPHICDVVYSNNFVILSSY